MRIIDDLITDKIKTIVKPQVVYMESATEYGYQFVDVVRNAWGEDETIKLQAFCQRHGIDTGDIQPLVQGVLQNFRMVPRSMFDAAVCPGDCFRLMEFRAGSAYATIHRSDVHPDLQMHDLIAAIRRLGYMYSDSTDDDVISVSVGTDCQWCAEISYVTILKLSNTIAT